jgi:type IV pilus assembly protein PilA
VIQAIQRRLAARQNENSEGGFTLIELMVVVMIIAILVGIAIPAFLGARKRAQDTASKSDLRNALGTAQTIYTDTQAYLPVADSAPGAADGMVSKLTSEEPSLTFQDNATASTVAKQISVLTKNSGIAGVSGLDEIVLASKSGSGTCYYLRHVSSAGNAISGTFQATSTSAACTGTGGDGLAAGAWSAL